MPNPILKVLSVLGTHRASYLLMGGQACVFYGAAEFSRDTDIAVLADAENVRRLSAALEELQAESIALPPFGREYLERGHAVHFRCQHPEARAMRIDVMSLMRGVPPFPELWQRRTTLELESGARIELMSLPDLVRAKKTQRDKDWLMIRRLVEGHFVQHREAPSPQQVAFWLRESRSAAMLLELARSYPEQCSAVIQDRPLLSLAQAEDDEGLARAIELEERGEREADRLYWAPLREELERMRHARRQQ